MGTSETKINLENLKAMFLAANRSFIENHASLLKRELSERCLCGTLMCELNKQLEKNACNNYYADIEFNRAFENTINNVKHLLDEEGTTKRVFPDIIVHSRGKVTPDNLLAIEMKKSTARREAKERDKNRLSLLTSSYPYKYKLGVYYEINFEEKQIIVEFYQDGENAEENILSYGDMTQRS